MGERQTEDLKVPGSIPGGGIFGITSPMAQSLARQAVNLQVAGSNPAGGDFAPMPQKRSPGIEPGFSAMHYCVTDVITTRPLALGIIPPPL